MATTSNRADERSEYCPACDRETAHTVSLQIITESENMDNAQFSREPYRVTECQVCGETDAVRMNNA
jgi:ribosomal protein L44E